MKATISYIALAAVSLFSACTTIKSQAPGSPSTTQPVKPFTFIADRAVPANVSDVDRVLRQMPGGAASSTLYNLSGSSYILRLRNDTLTAHLPYFGRSYNAPLSPDEQGINFSTTTFSRSVQSSGKKTVTVLETNGLRDNYRLTLEVFSPESATLSINSVNRQNITFQGHIQAPKQ